LGEILLKRVRKYVMEYFLENERPPLIEEIMQEFDMKRSAAQETLLGIEAEHNLALLPGTHRILMAHPFSAITTPFKVTIGSKKYYANCAWDSVAFHVMLSRDLHIDSFCHHCSEKISIHLENGKATSKPPEPLVFLSVPAAEWWNSIVNTCSNNMVFFSSPGHLDEWLSKNPSLKGETLTVEKTVELSRPTYTGKMELDFERPPKDELMKRWAAIGLTGDFWKL
jgi:alkylmercury lyase-like protein